jgi:fructose-1,6-bisphosphatase/inositol monophosphatase family enzyme
VETDDVLTLIVEVAEEVVNPRFRMLAAEDVAEKNPGDLVTVADREAEVRLTAALQDAYPDALVLGEEATTPDPGLLDRFRVADHAFTVDPVDGTKNFVHGSPDHAVMVAELRSGEVVRSWIWQPQHETAYVAERGAGAWRDGDRLTRAPAGLEPRGVTSRRSWIGRTLGPLPALRLTWVCCGVDYPKLVEGAVDYVLYWRPSPWDHAPGSLLLTEAGGYLGTSDGEPYQPVRDEPGILVVAADQDTYERVTGLLRAMPRR